MRAPTGVYRSNVYKTTRKPKPLAEMKKNYAILKKYYTIITRNTKVHRLTPDDARVSTQVERVQETHR